jgi:hypothetical protein
MLGFKRFHSAAVTLSGIELMHRIRKGQFDLTSMHLKRYHFAVDLDGGSFRSLRSAKHGRFLARLSSLHHSHLDNTRRLIASVQRLGAMVALDDFGAGYTSFPYLRELTADALKIDGEFVRNINGFPANAAIVEAIIGLARNLGMQSIAEWVEDAPTLDMLQAMGVDVCKVLLLHARSHPKSSFPPLPRPTSSPTPKFSP